ncbi:MAG TPA: permease-like cell division protein FtsX [Acidimicrobiales bacterium]|nr:permease-like cell division protein FtsX [Acidimicrobiales bacterium]
MKFDYIFRETVNNLRRNVTLTIAAIMTVAVSLALFGSTLLVRQGVDNVTVRWRDGIELIAFLRADVTDEQRTAIEAVLDESPEVADVRYVDREASHSEAMRLFERNEAMRAKLEANPDLVPDSYRVSPASNEIDLMASLGQQLAEQPGVLEVTDVSDSVKTVTGVSTFAQRAMLVVGVGLLVAALLLILNAIRMAMFARRREIEVMKLVGATNWFIRVPFMLEGIVQGLVGAGLALGAVFGLDRFMQRAAEHEDYRNIMEGFVATSTELWGTAAVVIALGVVIGAAGSGWALSRFLRV